MVHLDGVVADTRGSRFRANLWKTWGRGFLYAHSLYKDGDATLDDLRKAVNTLEEIEATARRVLGGAHPLTKGMEAELQNARAALRAREPKK